ncbi:MAG: helix-turn-helix domain-containing protein [Chitinophaga sp.]|uniref:helix-turn-helix domain-containing protein n=1 Tax=Chitinophaga sp. TaxID=1869181 RepID=UPI001B2C557C|nr:helix-turn-helix domain-containing protein [Chitinophaga sp.]MBO9727104.1 helix-turn-helix domain-containing protein [Chitinophaga sp.]
MALPSDYCVTSQSFKFNIERTDQWTENSYNVKCGEKCDDDVLRIFWITKCEFRENEGNTVDSKKNFLICFGNSNDYPFKVDLPAEGFFISFTKDFLNIGELELDLTCLSDFPHLFSSASVFIIDDGSAEDINDVVNRMHKEYNSCFTLKTAILRRYFKIFLIYLSRHLELHCKPVQQTRNMELVKQFMQAIEQNYQDKRMVADYADLLFVTANYLNEVVKKVTGYPAGHHIRSRVVVEAKRMATSTNSSMKEIAYRLGFNDSAHFSKFFKSTSGDNFSEFKKQGMKASLNIQLTTQFFKIP